MLIRRAVHQRVLGATFPEFTNFPGVNNLFTLSKYYLEKQIHDANKNNNNNNKLL